MTKEHWSNSDFFTKSNLVYAYTHKNWDASVPLHSHEFYELNIVLNGSGTHTLGDSCIGVRPGDVFVIPPSVKHTYTPDETLDIYHVLLQTEFLLRYFDDLNTLPGFKTLFEIEPTLREATGSSYFLHLRASELGEIKTEIDRIADAQANGQYGYQNLTALHLICILSMKIYLRSTAVKENVAPALTVMHTIEYIQNHLDQKLTVSHLAALSAMSEATYNRHFKKLIRMTPAEYIRQCRIKKAMQLLNEKKRSKTDIAIACGFFDVSHMNKYLG